MDKLKSLFYSDTGTVSVGFVGTITSFMHNWQAQLVFFLTVSLLLHKWYHVFIKRDWKDKDDE